MDEEVRQWCHRDLSPVRYPYLVVDVIYIKVRENHKVVSKACHIAIGISEEGKRRLLGFDISDGKSDDSWFRFFNHLKQRGLKGLKMVISDAHSGLVKAIKQTFINVSWQRCQVHFLRNILDKTPKKETKEFKEDIKALFRIQDIKIARMVKNELFNKYEGDKKYQASLAILDEGFEDAFTYLNESVVHSRLKSTNCLERLNEEIRRRERVIRIFPNVESAYRLIGAMLIDQDEEWLTAYRIYIQM